MQGNPFAKELNKWNLLDSISASGGGGTSNTKTITLPTFYNELLVTVESAGMVYASSVCTSGHSGVMAIYTGIDLAGNHTFSISAELSSTTLRVAHTYNRYGSTIAVDAKVYYR